MRTSIRWASTSCSLVLLAALATPPALRAQASAADCGAADRLAGRMATGHAGAAPALALLTDGQVLSEGAAWNSPGAVPLGAGERFAFDLGDALPLRALLLQADANDSYLVEGSLDGVAFERLGLLPELGELHGLRTRALGLAGAPVRFLRLRVAHGDGRAAVAEIQAFCAAPGEWAPRLQVIAAPLDSGAGRPPSRWNDVSSRWWELALALAGLALLAWDARSERRIRTAGGVRRRKVAFTVAGLVAILTYFNFGAFHFGSFVHGWDTFHYYIGAKYFRELGYERLYDCVAVADAAEPALRPAVEGRKLRNLRSNVLESTAGILADPGRCTDRFTAARWAEFRHDVAWFRERESADRWAAISSDHGYNATPVWNVAGSLLANLAPASDRQILLLCLLDPLYFLAMVAALVWAFGRPGAAVALLVLATSFPARFYWTGGAFLRWDWLCFTVLAVCCLRRGRPFAAGAALGYAALLRVFPGLLAVGPALVVLLVLVEAARSARGGARWRAVAAAFGAPRLAAERRFFAGALLAGALLVPASLAVGGGIDAYRGFVANTRKHQATPLTNNMGLRTVVTYRPSEIGRHLHAEGANDPWGRWKVARLAAWKSSRWAAAGLAATALLLVARGARRSREPWIALALSAAWIPFVVETTSYYYAFLVVPALLWTVRRSAGMLLLALGALSLWISLAPLSGMPTWRDEQYTWISLATVGVLLALLVTFAFSADPVPAAAPGCLSPPTGRAEAPRRADRPALRNRKELRT